MNVSPKKKRWRWALVVALVIVLGAGIGLPLVGRTPVGRAAFNVVAYRLRATWNRWFGDRAQQAQGGAIAGIVRDASGQPLTGATVLVSTLTGVVYQSHSDDLGTYHIRDVPPGRYVPAATKWGYEHMPYARGAEERTIVTVRSAQLTGGVDFTLPQRQLWHPALDDPPVIGPPQTGYALFPAEIAARRTPITYTNEGLIITTTLLYEPLDFEDVGPLPVMVTTYPSVPIGWDRVSVALASEGYVVLATGPSPQRALDIRGMGRDLLKAVAYLHDGQLTDRADNEREGWLSGSFSSLILYWAMQEGASDVDAFVIVGGISDGFLGVKSLYEDDPLLPERYHDAIAALGRTDRIPEFYLGHSLAFHAAQLSPALVVHTKQDEVIPYNQSLRLAEALAAEGVTHELFIYEDTTHYLDQVNVTPDTAELYRRLIAFLERYVRQR
jgi:hypothetical protein